MTTCQFDGVLVCWPLPILCQGCCVAAGDVKRSGEAGRGLQQSFASLTYPLYV